MADDVAWLAQQRRERLAAQGREMDGDGPPSMRSLLTGTAGTFGVAVAVLFFCSWGSLEYTEYGLNYSMVTRTVEQKGYKAGRYFLGVGHHFIVFPATVTTIQFADDAKSDASMLKSRTKDGLEVELEASLQYLIDNERLFDLYMKYGRRYHSIFVRMATDILTTAATQYTANEFFTDRSSIGLDMTEMLEQRFQERCFVTVPFFQLRTVILPKKFEESIQDTEVKKQDIQTANAQQQSLLVEYETKVIQAKRTVEVLEQEGQANARSVQLANDAYCEQLNASVALQAEAYHKMLKTTFKGDTLALLRSMHIRAMRDHTSGTTIINDPTNLNIK
jgi:hypothetical protein